MPIYQPHIYTRTHTHAHTRNVRTQRPSLYRLISHLRSRPAGARTLDSRSQLSHNADIRPQREYSVEGRRGFRTASRSAGNGKASYTRCSDLNDPAAPTYQLKRLESVIENPAKDRAMQRVIPFQLGFERITGCNLGQGRESLSFVD